MIDKTACLVVYVLLYGGAIVALFARAFARRRLLEYCRAVAGPAHSARTENRLRSLLLTIPRDIAALRELRKVNPEARGKIARTYRTFWLLTWIAVILIVCLVLFSFVAHRICQG